MSTAVDDLMALVWGLVRSFPNYDGRDKDLRTDIESALQASEHIGYERGRVAERALHVMAETTQQLEREQDAVPVAMSSATPPLPSPASWELGEPSFTAEQMRSYGEACAAAGREAFRALVADDAAAIT